MKVQAVVLLGGLFGVDGYVDSAGMEALANRLRKIPDVNVTVLPWTDWQSADALFRHLPDQTKVAVIGYSGGGSRGTYLCNSLWPRVVDLFIAYDPSPKWQMQPISSNVRQAICYHNTNPMLPVPLIGSLGGGLVTSVGGKPDVEVIDIAEEHLLVQENETLHQKTIAAVKAMI